MLYQQLNTDSVGVKVWLSPVRMDDVWDMTGKGVNSHGVGSIISIRIWNQKDMKSGHRHQQLNVETFLHNK